MIPVVGFVTPSKCTRSMLRMDGEWFTGWVVLYFETPDLARKAAQRRLVVRGSALILWWGGVLLP